jgi:hypothetical protein
MGIQYVYSINDFEVRHTIMYNKLDDLGRRTYLNGLEILANMLKEIILCDYYKEEYELLEPKTRLSGGI